MLRATRDKCDRRIVLADQHDGSEDGYGGRNDDEEFDAGKDEYEVEERRWAFLVAVEDWKACRSLPSRGAFHVDGDVAVVVVAWHFSF